MLAFVIMALVSGAAIAAYLLIPKDDTTRALVQIVKIFIVIMLATLAVTFVMAIGASNLTLKLF